MGRKKDPEPRRSQLNDAILSTVRGGFRIVGGMVHTPLGLSLADLRDSGREGQVFLPHRPFLHLPRERRVGTIGLRDEEQARETLELLEQMGEAYEQELRELKASAEA